MTAKCKFCSINEGEECCVSISHSKLGLYCTREKGHKGKHIACDTSTHKIEVWK